MLLSFIFSSHNHHFSPFFTHEKSCVRFWRGRLPRQNYVRDSSFCILLFTKKWLFHFLSQARSLKLDSIVAITYTRLNQKKRYGETECIVSIGSTLTEESQAINRKRNGKVLNLKENKE